MKKIIKITIIFFVLIMMIFSFAGCSVEKYNVEYNYKNSFLFAKDSYRAGQKVILVYPFYMIATDTDYSFWLDGEKLGYKYKEKIGFIIKFTMPEHDVFLECRSKNSMAYVIEEGEQA